MKEKEVLNIPLRQKNILKMLLSEDGWIKGSKMCIRDSHKTVSYINIFHYSFNTSAAFMIPSFVIILFSIWYASPAVILFEKSIFILSFFILYTLSFIEFEPISITAYFILLSFPLSVIYLNMY